MATYTDYYTLDGEIIGEETSGSRTDYLSDALGSVTATVNSSQAVVNTYRYKPSGSQLAKTGVGSDPRFRWNGGSGSRTNDRPRPFNYNLNRHVELQTARWTTRDVLFPSQLAYAYALSNPVNRIDPTGKVPIKECCCCPMSITIEDLQATYGPEKWGHTFNVVFTMKLINNAFGIDQASEACIPEWWEKTNKPYMNSWDGSWLNMFGLDAFRTLNLRMTWKLRTEQFAGKCPVMYRLPLVDYPGYSKDELKEVRGWDFRILCFRWVLRANPRCVPHCIEAGEKTSVEKSAVQRIAVTNPPLVVSLGFEENAKCSLR